MSDNRDYFFIEVRIVSAPDFSDKEEAELNKEIVNGLSETLAKISNKSEASDSKIPSITFDTPVSHLMEWKSK
jgi:hypothetical protein